MRKFNLEEAKAGKPVVTRLGRPVRILCWDAKGSDPIVGLIELDFTSYACNYNENGIFREGVESEQDLFMKSEKKEGWIVLEHDDSFSLGVNPFVDIHADINTAMEIAYKLGNRTVSKITWEA